MKRDGIEILMGTGGSARQTNKNHFYYRLPFTIDVGRDTLSEPSHFVNECLKDTKG